MEISQWTPNVHVSQRDGDARWADPFRAQTGNENTLRFPPACRSRNRMAIIHSTAFSLVLVIFLFSYFCLSSRGLRQSRTAVVRRLASGDEDETCKHILKLLGAVEEEGPNTPLGSQEPHQISEPKQNVNPRKRKPSPPTHGDDPMTKRPLLDKQMETLAGGLHDDFHFPATSSSHASGAQGVEGYAKPSGSSTELCASSTSLQGEQSSSGCPLSGDLQIRQPGSHNSSGPALSTEAETGSTGSEGVTDSGQLEERFLAPSLIDQWFLDYILEPPSTPYTGAEQYNDPQKIPVQGMANAADLLAHTNKHLPNLPSPFDHGSAIANAWLRVMDAQNVQENARPSAELDSSLPSLQGDQITLGYQFSGGLATTQKGADEANRTTLTTEAETASHGAEPMAYHSFLDMLRADEGTLEQQWLDAITEPSSSSFPRSGVGHYRDSPEFGGQTTADGADQLAHAHIKLAEPRTQVHGSKRSSAQLPLGDAHGVPPLLDPSGGSTEIDKDSAPLQNPFVLRHIPPFMKKQLQVPPLSLPTWPPNELRASTASVPSSSEAPSSEVHPPGSGPSHLTAETKSPEEHPLYRLPAADPPGQLTPFSLARAVMYTHRASFPQTLVSIHKLLNKERLQTEDQQSLIGLAEQLVKSLSYMGNFVKDSLPVSEIYEPMMRRFLTADALWCIGTVVGSPVGREDWWPQIMDKLLSIPNVKISYRQAKTMRYRFVCRLNAALQMYREGQRPAAAEVVELKREIFCSPHLPSRFRSRAYEVFREAAGC